MQEELDNFFEEHEKSIKEKHKLLIDFSTPADDIELSPSIRSVTNKLSIVPVLKSTKPEKSSRIKSEIIDLRNKKNNKNNKNNLF